MKSWKFDGEEMGLDMDGGNKQDGFGPEQNGEEVAQSVGSVVACGGSGLDQGAATEAKRARD